MPASENIRRRRVPSQGQLVLPLIDLLAEAGRPVKAIDAAVELGRRAGVSETDMARKTVTSDSQVVDVWRRHVRFAKLKAQQIGYVASAGRGAWVATEHGTEGVGRATPCYRVTVEVIRCGDRAGARIHVDIEAGIPSVHTLIQGDARNLSWIPDNEINLVVSSIPYHDVKHYSDDAGQIGGGRTYDEFLDEMQMVLAEINRVLMPGCRAAINVGDVLRSRKQHREHHVLPLHADMLVRGRKVGMHVLNGIAWQKIGNLSYEQGPGGILGKPNQPNQIIALDREHILLFRKPGDYRHPTPMQREASSISREERNAWFRGTWSDVPGASGKGWHPAPFPVEIPNRLIRMFSFAGDTVLDPFAGSFTTTVAAARAGRNSVGVEIAERFVEAGVRRVEADISSGRYSGKAAHQDQSYLL